MPQAGAGIPCESHDCTSDIFNYFVSCLLAFTQFGRLLVVNVFVTFAEVCYDVLSILGRIINYLHFMLAMSASLQQVLSLFFL